MGTVPVPYSPVAGDDATQARVLTWADTCAYLLGSATAGGSKRPLCVMRQTVVQSLATGVAGAILMDTEDVDYDNGHSTVTNTSRYTAQTAGWHLVAGSLAVSANVTGDRICFLAKNGTEIPGTRTAMSADTVVGAQTLLPTPARLVSLAVGDFVELWGFQSSGGALNTYVTSPQGSYLGVEWRSN